MLFRLFPLWYHVAFGLFDIIPKNETFGSFYFLFYTMILPLSIVSHTSKKAIQTSPSRFQTIKKIVRKLKKGSRSYNLIRVIAPKSLDFKVFYNLLSLYP